MTQAVKCIIDLFWSLYNTVNDKLVFDLFGYQIHFMTFAISCIVLGFVISIFWKGVKS